MYLGVTCVGTPPIEVRWSVTHRVVGRLVLLWFVRNSSCATYNMQPVLTFNSHYFANLRRFVWRSSLQSVMQFNVDTARTSDSTGVDSVRRWENVALYALQERIHTRQRRGQAYVRMSIPRCSKEETSESGRQRWAGLSAWRGRFEYILEETSGRHQAVIQCQ
jgi:hypothetical protein